MRNLVIKGIVAVLVCLLLGGSINTFAFAKVEGDVPGNVKNNLFHFKANNVTYTEYEYKANNSRAYVIISDGNNGAKVSVYGKNNSKDSNHSCSKSALSLKKYTEYTIYNWVYGSKADGRPRYQNALLRLEPNAAGSGYWSPDSTKDYHNIG